MRKIMRRSYEGIYEKNIQAGFILGKYEEEL